MATTKVTIKFEFEVDRDEGEYPESRFRDVIQNNDYLHYQIIKALYAGYASIVDTNGHKIGMVKVKTR